MAQSEDTPQGAHLHAYLHRTEGDETNASYWYARAPRPFLNQPQDEEWANLVKTFV